MKKELVLIVVTVLASIAVFRIHNAESLRNERLFSFPMEIGKWSGREIKMESWIFDSLETPYAILRDYHSSDRETVNLAITWYDDKEVAFHAPEACLGGVGNKVREKGVEKIVINGSQSYEIGRIVAVKNGMRLLVLYFFANDGYITASQSQVRAQVLLKRLQFKRTSAAFVRVMSAITKNEEHASALLKEFLITTLPLVIEYTDTQQSP